MLLNLHTKKVVWLKPLFSGFSIKAANRSSLQIQPPFQLRASLALFPQEVETILIKNDDLLPSRIEVESGLRVSKITRTAQSVVRTTNSVRSICSKGVREFWQRPLLREDTHDHAMYQRQSPNDFSPVSKGIQVSQNCTFTIS